MPPERYPPDDPREWLNRARSNLLRAKNRIPDVYFEDLCLDAQQAAEKAIKGVMILRGIEFPYSHDLRLLLVTLEASGKPLSPPYSVREDCRAMRAQPATPSQTCRSPKLSIAKPSRLPRMSSVGPKGCAATSNRSWPETSENHA